MDLEFMSMTIVLCTYKLNQTKLIAFVLNPVRMILKQ